MRQSVFRSSPILPSTARLYLRETKLHFLRITYVNWYLSVLKNYAQFSGRARRKEYWMFVLCNLIISFAFSLAAGLTGAKLFLTLSNIYSLAVLIPAIACGVRRMHDTGRSGWWLLVPFANLVFACTEGTKGANRFGTDPKAVVVGV